MIQIDQFDFEKYCPSAVNPEGYGIFNLLGGAVERAERSAWDMLDGETQTEICRYPETHPDIIEAFKRYISLSAFDEAIPHLDIVLTPTGFGVVSNQNVAPASADRVERLRRQVRDSRDDALDDLIDILRRLPTWCDSPQSRNYIPSLIWHSRHLVLAGFSQPHRTKLRELTPLIAQADRRLRSTLGNVLVDELVINERANTVVAEYEYVVTLARIYMCEIIAERSRASIDEARRNLLGYLECRIDDFPAYKASSAYRANHSTRYENKKDDSCYFF